MNATICRSGPRDDVRHGVKALLGAAEGFQFLAPEVRKEIAGSLVRISNTAMNLAEVAGDTPPPTYPRSVNRPRPTSFALTAGDQFSGAAVDRIAPTTQNILQAVSFPRFVAELITGVFKAMNDSNQQQMTAFVELIRNVAASTEGFSDANTSVAGARNFLADRFPGSFMVQGAETDDFDDPEQMSEEERAEYEAEIDANTMLVLRPGATMPEEGALRLALGLAPGDSVPGGNPESLVGIARSAMARNRQQILSTMVMMGLQRIVIESGRLNASMRFHIDASSVAAEDRGSRFDMRHSSQGRVGARVGPWGAEATIQNTIGYVSTERTQTEEQLNAELDLNSSVELVFRSDYVPLNRLAGTGDVERIRVNTINPGEEARLASEDSRARAEQRAISRREGGERLNSDLRSVPTNSPVPESLPSSAAPETGSETPATGNSTGAAPPDSGSEAPDTSSPSGPAAPSTPSEETAANPSPG